MTNYSLVSAWLIGAIAIGILILIGRVIQAIMREPVSAIVMIAVGVGISLTPVVFGYVILEVADAIRV